MVSSRCFVRPLYSKPTGENNNIGMECTNLNAMSFTNNNSRSSCGLITGDA